MAKLISSFILLMIFCSVSLIGAPAPTDSIPPAGEDIIKKGIEQFEKGNYEEAIKIFSKVSPCDPAYRKCCYETALCYESLKNYSVALQKCEEAMSHDSTDIQSCIFKGNLLDELNRRDEAIAWLEKYRKNNPYNSALLYNLAICYMNKGDLQKAEDLLITELHYNPYHTTSHLALAKINYMMGRKAQSFLGYNMGILMNPRVNYIKEYEESISGERDSVSKSYLYPYAAGIDHSKWDELTGLLNAEIAFKEDFPYDFKLNYLSCRQTFLLFQKMRFDEKDTSFYNQFYVRFFTRVLQEKELETYLYYTLQNTDNKIVTEWTKKNSDLIAGFVEHAKASVDTWKGYGFSSINEGKHTTMYHFNDNGKLAGIGAMIVLKDSVKVGPWQYINEEGAVSQIGTYKNNLKEGDYQIFWPDGSVKQRLNYKNDNLDGINYTFHPNGVKSGIFPRINGITEGLEEEFNSAGMLVSSNQYKNGKSEGRSIYVDYENGFSRVKNYVDDKFEGKAEEKWLNGMVKSESAYAGNLLTGTFKKWYANGKPEWEGNYDKNIQVGKWVSYYADGTKRSEGTCDEKGNPTGISKEFDTHGNLSSMISGYKDGKSDGTEILYFPDGKIQAKFVMTEGIIRNMECFNQTGEKIYTADEKNGVLKYKFFYPEGFIKLEGNILNGGRDSTWTTYSPNGKVIHKQNWSGDLESGLQSSFFENGNPKLILTCDSGKVSGKVIRYYPNGHISLTGYYNADGLSTGEWISYYYNDSIEFRSWHSDDKPAGRRMNYSPDGKLVMIETFNNEGEPVRYSYFDGAGVKAEELNFPYDSVNLSLHYPDGKLRAKFSMNDRKKNGVEEYYFPNGQLQRQQKYIYGNAQGGYHEWDYRGRPVQVRNYSMNQLEGEWHQYEKGITEYTDSYIMGVNQGFYREFHPNGHVFRSIKVEEGERQGKVDCFAPDSTWMYSLKYRDDEIFSISYRDQQGKMHTDERIIDSMKEIVCYYNNGKISARLPFVKGLFDGMYALYYPNGKLLREITYVNDYREGFTKYYYDNGTLKESCDWLNGSRNGHYSSSFVNGQKEMEGNYLANKKVGKWLVYNQSGKLVETLYYANDELYEIR